MVPAFSEDPGLVGVQGKNLWSSVLKEETKNRRRGFPVWYNG